MKHFKKLTLIVTTAMLFCLTTADNTGITILNSSATLEEQKNIQPLADEEAYNETDYVKRI